MSMPTIHPTPSPTFEFTPSISERTRLARDARSASSTYINGNGHENGAGSSSMKRERSSGVSGLAIASGNESTPGPSTAPINGEKKRKKKGWKGWALVIEDDEGNLIDVNDGPDVEPLPPRRARGRLSAPAAVVSEQEQRSSRRASRSPPRYRELTIDSIISEPEILPVSKRSRREHSSSLLGNGSHEPISADQPDPQPKKSRRSSSPNTPLPDPYPQPQPTDLPMPKSAKPNGPRHSLPKSKPPRPSHITAPTRTQPGRGRGGLDSAPSSARATPSAEDKERNQPSRLPRSSMGMRNDTPFESDVRSEAAFIIAQAALRRQESATIKPPQPDGFGSTPSASAGQASSSSGNYNMPLSPPQSSSIRSDPIIRHPASAADDVQEEDFDTAFEKVQTAYRNGIRPYNNPRAPQKLTVPINGMEDANPPEWRSDQRPGIVLAPGRDRLLPTDKMELAHRQGFDGLTTDLEVDAQGFVNNVRDNLQNILTYYFPHPTSAARRDAFLERIGRGLADFGWQLTDSSSASLPPPSDHVRR